MKVYESRYIFITPGGPWFENICCRGPLDKILRKVWALLHWVARFKFKQKILSTRNVLFSPISLLTPPSNKHTSNHAVLQQPPLQYTKTCDKRNAKILPSTVILFSIFPISHFIYIGDDSFLYKSDLTLFNIHLGIEEHWKRAAYRALESSFILTFTV